MTDDLAAFLRARLDEDEAAAKAATAGPWEWKPEKDGSEWTDQGPWLRSKTATWTLDGNGPYPVTVIGAWGHDAWGVCIEDADAAHVALHDPDRALKEVEAGRRLLAEYERLLKNQEHHAAALDEWKADVEHEERAGQWAGAGNPGSRSLALGREGDLLGAMIPILRALIAAHAAVYDRHPDYRQEWAFPRS